MKICIGSDGSDLNSKMAKRFGHANYYLIYDSLQKIIVNASINVHDEEKHDHKNLLDLIDVGAEIFIVGNIGPHAFEILKSGGVKLFLARNITVSAAIEKYLNGELEELVEPTVKKSIGH